MLFRSFGLPDAFSDSIEAAAQAISEQIPEQEIQNRKDFRKHCTFTIDPQDAKDFDDALSVQINSENVIQIGVHIADVTHYVKPGTELDEEAYSRATSVYLVDRCIPMLPERLSNNLCSLRPHEDKLCFSAVFELNLQGQLLNEWFGKIGRAHV